MEKIDKTVIKEELTKNFDFNENDWSITLKAEIDSEMLSAIITFYKLFVEAHTPKATTTKKVAKIKDRPTIIVCSPGGDLFCTFGIIDTMNFYEKKMGIKTDVTVVGPAFSGASLISVCGTGTRKIGENSYLMVHDIWSIADSSFTASDVKKKNEYLTELQNRYIGLFVSKSKLTIDQITINLRDDVYYNAIECVKLGLMDEIL